MNSAYRLLGWGTMPIGALLGGVVAETVGVRPTFLVAALLHLPLLLGFRVIAEARIAKAEAEGADTLQEWTLADSAPRVAAAAIPQPLPDRKSGRQPLPGGLLVPWHSASATA